ncbi:hypothetical protein MMIC_P0629 [Mariprofundus micogutta]|uniref:Uncharacterized protein n=1 Tax=Mariprofundus micogutta TaxID=1921010 RepID=A0A1L8CL78_9PROT|nr:hypothetical protein MMIC_P0629 [Mariprofundus micogutta]
MVRDFIGPSIDIGFRVASLSTPRKMMVSVDLALLVAKVRGATSPEDNPPMLDLRYDGKKILKGVLDNKPYPMFWIDTMPDSEEEISNQEAEILGYNVSTIENIKIFVDEFISTHGGDLFCCLPYIINDKAALFSKRQPPAKHKRVIDAYSAMYDGVSDDPE